MIRLSIALFLISATARAEPPRKAQSEPAPLQYDFDDQIVAGDYPAPTEIFTIARGRNQRTSLITLRENFVNELAKSIEDM